MGGSSWSDASYSSRVNSSKSTHGTAFTYDKDILTGKTSAGTHDDLNPKNIKMRESRDSDAHPDSNAIIIALDVTGSMGRVTREIHEKLPKIMGLLTRKGYINDPQILFSAIGDAKCDSAPLQVGQFESGAEMEGDLSKFFIEGGGGGQMMESYELFAYMAAKRTSIDCFEKRNKKGYCFIIGDELPYDNVSASEIRDVCGGGAENNIPVAEIFNELKEKYIVFFILPAEAGHGGDSRVVTAWQEVVGAEHVIKLKDTNGVAEVIATQIGLCEGTTDVGGVIADLEEHGTEEGLIRAVTGSVSKAYAGAVAKVDPSALDTAGTDNVKRV